MATQFADKAKDAFLDDDFDRAVEFYSKAIDLNPSVADFYADRAQAQIKLNNFTEAVADANKAIELDPSMVKAYLRKGTACVKLEEYHTAKTALQAGDSHAPGDIRHEFYQQPEEVVVTIFAEGIPANNVVVDFDEQIIVPEKSRYQVLSTKIEICLVKAEYINWPSLEYRKEISVPQKVNYSSAGSQRPAYPSSKSRGKDWDRLEAQVKKEEKEEKLDGDAAVNKLFQEILKNADEDKEDHEQIFCGVKWNSTVN